MYVQLRAVPSRRVWVYSRLKMVSFRGNLFPLTRIALLLSRLLDFISVSSLTSAAFRRDVTITPSNTWGGQGMLGVTIRFDTYHNADDNLVSAAPPLSHTTYGFGHALCFLSRLF